MNRQTGTLALLTLILPMMTGCLSLTSTMTTGNVRPSTSPGLASMTDPAFRGHQFNRIIVSDAVNDLQTRHELEHQLVREFARCGIDARRSLDYFPPTRSWSITEIRDTMKVYGIEAWLTLMVDSSGVAVRHIPETNVTKVTMERKGRAGREGKDSVQWETENETTTTTVNGGYEERTPWMRYKVVLTEATSGQTAWMALSGITESKQKEIEEFNRLVAAQLIYDGLVKKAGMSGSP